jgi:hypothetical protein
MSTRSRSRSATVETQIIPPETAPLAIVEDLKAAVLRGELTSKLARELMVRLAPPARAPRPQLELPEISSAESFAEATKVVLRAAAAGQLAPGDALTLLRLAKITLEAHRLVERTRR